MGTFTKDVNWHLKSLHRKTDLIFENFTEFDLILKVEFFFMKIIKSFFVDRARVNSMIKSKRNSRNNLLNSLLL